MERETVLCLTDISKSFSLVKVLNKVSLSLYPGEVHCLMGENGAGKSTLIKIISGAYKADEGVITYQGQKLVDVGMRWAREAGINTIYQEIDLVPHLSAEENILLGNEFCEKLGNISRKKARIRAMELFDKLGVEIPLGVPVGNLRLVQQQMVSIAKALHMNSKVIILDEPTSVFTSKEVKILFRIIEELKAEGIAILYISHHMEEIFTIGDRITVLRDGELIRTGELNTFTKESLIQAMVGRNIEFTREEKVSTKGEVLLKVKDLVAGNMVKGVSFELHKGELLGFGGLVGAGRTETMRAIVGIDRIDSGEVFVKNEKKHIRSPRQALQAGLGILPESRAEEGIVGERAIKDNITYSYIEKQYKSVLVNWKETKNKAKEMIRKMTIRPETPKKQIRYLSGGNQQKVVLGKILAAKCDIIILDEPTRGVDVGARTEIYAIIKQMLAEGKAVIMVSSDMTELLTQSDRIIVMSKGRIVGEMDGAEATEEKVLVEALKVGE
jgi:ABC-type sugar transport system, ATPase component